MLTRQQKSQQIDESVQELQKSESLILVDFDKLPTADLQNLRLLLREFHGKFKVIKKRLLKIAFQKAGVAVDPTQFASQVGTVLVPADLYGVAGKIYKFIKDLTKSKKDLKILTVFDLKNKRAVGIEEFNAIAKLPSREILLAQVAMMFTMPMKKLLLALNGRMDKIKQ